MQPVTFRTLAEQEGAPLQDPLPQQWPLERWFASLCDTPLTQFPVGDLARSCRQNIYPGAVLPYCLRALEIAPLAGHLYNGELLLSVLKLPETVWEDHSEQRARVVAICSYALREATEEDDADVILNIKDWMSQQLRETEVQNRLLSSL